MPGVLIVIKGLGRGGAEQLLASSAPYLDRERFRYRFAYLLPWKDSLVAELARPGAGRLPGWGQGAGLGRPAARPGPPRGHRPRPPPLAGGRGRGQGRARPPDPDRLHRAQRLGPLPPATYAANLATFPRNDHVFAVSETVAGSVRYPGPLRASAHADGRDPPPRPRPGRGRRRGGHDGVRGEIGIPRTRRWSATWPTSRRQGPPTLLRAAARSARPCPKSRFLLSGRGRWRPSPGGWPPISASTGRSCSPASGPTPPAARRLRRVHPLVDLRGPADRPDRGDGARLAGGGDPGRRRPRGAAPTASRACWCPPRPGRPGRRAARLLGDPSLRAGWARPRRRGPQTSTSARRCGAWSRSTPSCWPEPCSTRRRALDELAVGLPRRRRPPRRAGLPGAWWRAPEQRRPSLAGLAPAAAGAPRGGHRAPRPGSGGRRRRGGDRRRGRGALAAFDRRGASRAWPGLLAVPVAGVWATVPDVEAALVAARGGAALALLGWPGPPGQERPRGPGAGRVAGQSPGCSSGRWPPAARAPRVDGGRPGLPGPAGVEPVARGSTRGAGAPSTPWSAGPGWPGRPWPPSSPWSRSPPGWSAAQSGRRQPWGWPWSSWGWRWRRGSPWPGGRRAAAYRPVGPTA